MAMSPDGDSDTSNKRQGKRPATIPVAPMAMPRERIKLPLVEVPLGMLLVLATTINMALIFGGTLYAGYKVTSIQQTYEVAQQKLDLAGKEFKRTEESFEAQKHKAADIAAQVDAILLKSSQLDEQLSQIRRQGSEAVRSISDEAHKQADRLEAELAAFDSSLISRQNTVKSDIEAAMNKTIGEAKDYSLQIERQTRAALDNLSSQKMEIEKLQLDSRRQLLAAAKAEADFSKDLESLRDKSKLDLDMAWRYSSAGMRTVALGIAALLLTSTVLSFRAFFRK